MASSVHTFSYIENMVSKPVWKEILLDLISKNSIDPWNIDLVDLSDAFIKKIREMEKMDFVVPANIILAAAILLKYKSNYLKFLSYQTELPEFAPESDTGAFVAEEMPVLTLSSRIPPKRQITLPELLTEMERIIKYDTTERIKIPRGSIVDIVDLELSDHNIDQDLESVFEQIKKNVDSEGWALFSRLVTGKEPTEVVYQLLCVLYLVQKGSIDLKQDTLFGEVFIRLLDPKTTSN
ncbi:segregation/condensation protein A [Candidatus Micrarchaeota archaeon]|nr:segregation/condensation protein A [Candidatus Micrarchaeota archaeon]